MDMRFGPHMAGRAVRARVHQALAVAEALPPEPAEVAWTVLEPLKEVRSVRSVLDVSVEEAAAEIEIRGEARGEACGRAEGRQCALIKVLPARFGEAVAACQACIAPRTMRTDGIGGCSWR